MRLLLDTHAFLFAIGDPEQLSAKARRAIEDPENERWLSVVSLWEIAIKAQTGKLRMPLEREYYSRHMAAAQLRPLDVIFSHTMTFLGLPLFHRDAFDRMLVAQAITEDLILVTRDRELKKYDIRTIW